ncbi:MAG: tetratricopeptide repeat protein, partial [Bacteroidota bacterium]
MKFSLKYLSAHILLCISLPLFSQESIWFQNLEKALAEEELELAEQLYSHQISHYQKLKNYDSLSYYPPLLGHLVRRTTSSEEALLRTKHFVEKLEQQTSDPKILRQAWLEASSFFEVMGKTQEAFEQNKTALEYTKKWKEATGEDYGLILSNMGVYARLLGDMQASSSYFKQSLTQYLSYPKTKKESLQIIYNSYGATMWFSLKLDSARYYYGKALEILEEMEETPRNLYYRPAILNNNIAAIYSMEGQATKSLQAMQECIRALEKYIPTVENGIQLQKAQEFKFQAIDNLASIYKDIGDYRKSYELIAYAARQKAEHLPDDSPEQFKSLVLLGQSELYLREFEQAALHLDSAIARIARKEGNFGQWNADAHHHRAEVFKELGEIGQAERYYEKTEQLVEEVFQGEYDEISLGYLIQASTFYAEVGKREKALKIAKHGYEYALKTLTKDNLLSFQMVWNLADIYYLLGDYEKVLEVSKEGMAIIKGHKLERKTLLDSIQVEYRLP